MAIGVSSVATYVESFLYSASAVIALGSELVRDTWVAAKVYVQVKSQVSSHPHFKGTTVFRVALSGLPLLVYKADATHFQIKA